MNDQSPSADGRTEEIAPEQTVVPVIPVLTERIVELSRRFAQAVVAGCMLLTVLFGWYMTTHLGIDADTAHLLDPSAPWRQAEIEIERLFPPRSGQLVIVVDGATPELAEDAAARLAARLAERPDMFHSVRRPDASEFFRRNGLLFLPEDKLEELTDSLARAQPLIAAVAADPSANGLFGALNLALEGAAMGEMNAADLDPSLAAIADSLDGARNGTTIPLSWQKLMLDGDAAQLDQQRIILARPVLDFSRLAPGAAATSVVRATAADLGLKDANGTRVRLTGPVALNDEEFTSVTKGIGFATVGSFLVVLCWLFLALHSFKPILAIALTLLIGLVWTLAFAAAAVGDLNLISVAFTAMYIGIAVDFGIQVCVRYRDERFRHDDLTAALRRTGRSIGGPLFLAAITTAVGFLAFAPTEYRGVAELGVIAGAGMLIAFFLSITLLPALLMILKPGGERAPIGYVWTAGLDRFLVRRRFWVIGGAAVLGLGALTLLPFQQFDFNPLHLKDPRAESVATLHELMANEVTTPNTLEVLRPSTEEAAALAARLERLPEVRQAISVSSFIPEDQDTKLALIEDARLLLLPSLLPSEIEQPPDAATTLRTASETVERLAELPDATPAARHLAAVLSGLLTTGEDGVALMERTLTWGLPRLLETLRLALSAEPVTLAMLPEDLRGDWVVPDGRARIEIYPSGDSNDNATLVRFVEAVRQIVPDVTGTALLLQKSGESVWRAFQIAGVFALVSVVALLALVLRRIRDVVLVIAPLCFAALMTAATAVLIGFSVNFANVIALPLLFGIGVAFSIYFVVNWRAGRPDPLQSSTARAVLFSGLTTLTAFSSLSVSGHLGTAAMGWLLTIGLCHTLLATLLLLPALLGPVPTQR